MRHALLCLALLPPFWSWDAVTANCKGAPEPEVVYQVVQMLAEPAGYVRFCATNPDIGGEVCVDRIQYTRSIADVDETAETHFPQAEVYTPRRGGVTFIDVQAVDPARNISGGPCP